MRNKTLSIFTLFPIFLFFLNGCAKGGLERTSWVNLERTNYQSLGFSLNLPKQPVSIFNQYYVKIYESDSYQKVTGFKTIDFAFHPLKSGQLLTEPDFFLTVEINVTNPGDTSLDLYSRYVEENSKNSYDKYTSSVVNWIGIDKYSIRRYYLFRKDIKCLDGSIITAGAKLVIAPHINKEEDKDKIRIKKLLDSISCLSQ